MKHFLSIFATAASTLIGGSCIANAQTLQEVTKTSVVFASCMGCDSQIYFHKGKWYEIEQDGGYVSQSWKPGDKPRIHALTSVQRISSHVVSFDGRYFCSWASYKGPRRQVACTGAGWKTLSADASAPPAPLGPSPTQGMDYRTALIDIRAREAMALFNLRQDFRYLDLYNCLEDQKKTKLDFYDAMNKCRNFAGIR
jgi:hypothetical protein